MSAVYVALGDSMSIDDYAGGPGRGAASLLFRNRDDDFPDWAGRHLSTGAGATGEWESLILAQDGAVTWQVMADQLPRIDRPPALVTISMGGNDLLSAYGDVSVAEARVSEVMAYGEMILNRLTAIGGKDCPIVLTTVYDPSDGTGEVATSYLPAWPEAPEILRSLNSAITELARRHGALVADAHTAFLGHGVDAGDPNQRQARPVNTDLWYYGTIEPNAWGAHHIRRTWWEALERSGWRP